MPDDDRATRGVLTDLQRADVGVGGDAASRIKGGRCAGVGELDTLTRKGAGGPLGDEGMGGGGGVCHTPRLAA